MEQEAVNEAIGEAIFLLEKAIDPYKAPEAREQFVNEALTELKGVYAIAIIEEDEEDEDDLLEDFDSDFDEDDDEDDEDEYDLEDDDEDDEDEEE